MQAGVAHISLMWYYYIVRFPTKRDIMSERMDRKKAERRDRILDVAEKMIASKGFDGMTMEDIAKAADVAAGTPYLHFRNKNSLCIAVMVRLLKQMGDAEREQAALYNTGSEKLRAYRKALSDFIVLNPEKWDAMRQLRRSLDFSDTQDENVAELLKLYNQYIQTVAQLYRDGIREGTVRPDVDPLVAAIFMYQALIISVDISPLLKATLQMNDIEPERWLDATDDLLTMATHTMQPKEKIKRKSPLCDRGN